MKKGDLLAEIDPRPYQAQLDQAIANRDRDQALVVNAQANLDRYTPLAAKGYATSQLVDTQKAQLAQLQAMVKSDEAIIEQARTNLSYTQLTSPIDGVTGIRQVDEGNIIHPTDPNGLVDVTQIQPISLIFSLPQTTFVEIQQQMAKGPLTVLAYSQDDKTKLDEGKLDLIDNQIVQTTGTIRLRASFPNTQRQLWPGELVNARLLLETRQNGLTIAASAVQQGPNGAFVWVIGSDGTVQMRPVDRRADQRRTGADRFRASGQRERRDRRPIPAPARLSRARAARQGRAGGGLAERRGAGDPVNISAPFIHRPIATVAADGGPVAVRARDLPAVAGRLPAERQLPDHSGDGAAAGRRSADHGVLGRDAARAAVLADPRRHAAHLVERARLHPAHGPVRAEPRRRQRRDRRPGGDQRGKPVPAARTSPIRRRSAR